ncbi:transglycosylase SLT domain-containing protein [Aggregatibacter actinomycetemcomitans]|uniref:transglycosylase SLT domain-containing protein n=1 Tax=Aggregatibacter actinomycetemcomitans TaxID=714 RepID=UPI00197CA15F|nr:transglycosylase SLT domain-containing protein [Aggregatibacter actinomycetemcomitans]MBN6060435.1 transglycosylase SLT domain-containing protein [Aggregatibacter actinomycetemcomitans]MBN6088987.1 transglycosylase SLT domain-containing protein [Aggregatibacter actinomycetemcomitans]
MRLVHCTNKCFKYCCYTFASLLLSSLLCVPLAFAMPAKAEQYQRTLTRESYAVWGLNAPIPVFAAQIHQESQWKTTALSPVGAQGLAQFMPKTADWISALYPELADNQPYNPDWALRALVHYNRFNYERITARTECDRMAFMLSAYNGGLGWVQKDKRKAREQGLDPLTYWQNVELVNSGRSRANFAENRGYPQSIIYCWQPLYINWGIPQCL